MHGIKKGDKTFEVSQETITKYRKLVKLVFARKAAKKYDDQTLMLTKTVLGLNKEFYSLWNYRKDAISSRLRDEVDFEKDEKDKEEESSKESETYSLLPELISSELKFTEAFIAKNAKVYPVWDHRMFLIITLWNRYATHSVKESLRTVFRDILENEISLCSKCLSVDGRNFHCWNYRTEIRKMYENEIYLHYKDQITTTWESYCSELKDVALSDLEFTQSMIKSNFSNHSAWHRRSGALKLLFKASLLEICGYDDYLFIPTYSAPLSKFIELVSDHSMIIKLTEVISDRIKLEYEFSQAAFYVLPDDESSWRFIVWLLRDAEWWNDNLDTFRSEILASFWTMVEELIKLEDSAKWPKLSILLLSELLINYNGEKKTVDVFRKDDVFLAFYYKNTKMGGDGGTIATKRDVVVQQIRERLGESVFKGQSLYTCSISGKPLEEGNICVDKLGNLFCYDVILKNLIDKSMPLRFSHISTRKNVIRINSKVFQHGILCELSKSVLSKSNPFFVYSPCGCACAKGLCEQIIGFEMEISPQKDMIVCPACRLKYLERIEIGS
ncbi:Geranylgeranyl transferase type-2 subunit alpha like protein [Aduncisulcus paluster]|uniref:Geranylgeranyl transferase type-2 subunit alpha n=1 Tax=Aduncisulcus paluster TaxID=2918883 RepID=A0ABQ5KJS1_9EUKA|nr:Geranylgeranyl transferase type-2 subunit alpha like protein [Aduncisulcus paluster]